MLDDGKCEKEDCLYKCVSWKEEGTASSTYTDQRGCTVSCEERLYCRSWGLVKEGHRGLWQDNTYKCKNWSKVAPKRPQMCHCLKAATKPECDFAEIAKKYIEGHQNKEDCKQAAQSGPKDKRNKCESCADLLVTCRHDYCQLKVNNDLTQTTADALDKAKADIQKKEEDCDHLRKPCLACASDCHEYDACKTLRSCSEALKTCLP